jgi:hypothetical protein
LATERAKKGEEKRRVGEVWRVSGEEERVAGEEERVAATGARVAATRFAFTVPWVLGDIRKPQRASAQREGGARHPPSATRGW